MKIKEVSILELRDHQHENMQRFVEITADSGLKGHAGPLDGEYQFRAVNERLVLFNKAMADRDISDRGLDFANLWASIYPDKPLDAYEKGRDPLTGENVWQMHRTSRHSQTGEVITGFSAVDIALWDLRGKAAGMPVYKLLGGSRAKLPVYVSCMRNRTPEDALEKGKYWYDRGFKQHKCFLPHRPNEAGGIAANLEMAEAVRKGLPSDAQIMFDLSRLSEQADDPETRGERLKWAGDMVKGLGKYGPYWVEEPVSPDDFAGYAEIRKAAPGIKISAGEHIYTRWNLKPFLEKGLLDFVQCDPEWCGGISEFVEICNMVGREYPGVKIIPHGHMILAATQAVASQPENIVPEAEYLFQVIPERIRYLARPVEPSAGFFAMPEEPGIGPSLDPEKYELVCVYKG